MKRTEWMRKRFAAALCAAIAILAASTSVRATQVAVVTAKGASARELYGAQKLRSALAELKTAPAGARVLVAVRSAPELAHFDLPEFWPQAQEAFLIRQIGKTWIVTGSDPSGVLYGELELADRVRAAKALPAGIDDMEHPALKLRGTCIGMQKQEITYDGAEYDYPYTPQNFPFFYDKAAWINISICWPRTASIRSTCGTAIPSLPAEAAEISRGAGVARRRSCNSNIALFHWLTAEADRRGIWVIQGFYNIHLSHAFASAQHLPYHLSAPNAEASAYTRY